MGRCSFSPRPLILTATTKFTFSVTLTPISADGGVQTMLEEARQRSEDGNKGCVILPCDYVFTVSQRHIYWTLSLLSEHSSRLLNASISLYSALSRNFVSLKLRLVGISARRVSSTLLSFNHPPAISPPSQSLRVYLTLLYHIATHFKQSSVYRLLR